ncbi:hypothetical protein N9L68_07730 [bacterium]|nr:hypothetical protein [bacterium]
MMSDMALKDAIRSYVAEVEEEEREERGPIDGPTEAEVTEPSVTLIMGEEEEKEHYYLDHVFPRGLTVDEAVRQKAWLTSPKKHEPLSACHTICWATNRHRSWRSL